jgi:hypothetical protein
MDDFNAVESGLELFLQLFTRLSENNGENTQLLKELIPNLLEKGFSIFAQPEVPSITFTFLNFIVKRKFEREDLATYLSGFQVHFIC